MPCASFSMLDGLGGTGIEKLLLKTQVSLTSFLQSEVKIIHIIVQNNTYYSARSRWTKQQHSCVRSCNPFVVLTTSSEGLVGCRSFFYRPAWTSTVNCPGRATQETSTPNKTCRRCKNDERPTRTTQLIEWDDGET